jgi:hypothetical protein
MDPEKLNCDVLVIGGGAAGVAAALAAGRCGARVILLERYGFLGGLATAAQVGTICGLYLRDTGGPDPLPVGGGFPAEFAARLQASSPAKPLRVDQGLWVLPYFPPDFSRLADTLLAETPNVRQILHATVTQVHADQSRLHEVRALAWNQPLHLSAASVVDTTGEATVAALSGCAVEDAGTDQSPALVFVVENVDPQLADRGLLEVRRALRIGVEEGALPALCGRISIVPGSGRHGSFAFKLSLLPADAAKPLWQQVSEWEREGRATLDELIRFLTQHVAAFQHARLGGIAPQLGVRSGRRLLGRSRLSDEDVLGARKSAQAVARGCWPMERWTERPKPEMTYFAERAYYDIPLDCLRCAELENVFAAGRCFSATTGAMTSARVIGTALGTGWAAGTAAAFQSQGRPLADAIAQLQKQLAAAP